MAAVILTEVAQKISDILNGIDAETIGISRDNQYEFVVATEGFHLDYIYDKETKKNFIPVFIGSIGGENNPIPDLDESDTTIPVTIYFPVKFKDDFFLINKYFTPPPVLALNSSTKTSPSLRII